jgi:hypothetical protein
MLCTTHAVDTGGRGFLGEAVKLLDEKGLYVFERGSPGGLAEAKEDVMGVLAQWYGEKPHSDAVHLSGCVASVKV